MKTLNRIFPARVWFLAALFVCARCLAQTTYNQALTNNFATGANAIEKNATAGTAANFQTAVATDAKNMEITSGGFIPATFWAFGWSMVSLLMLAATLWVYYRSLKSSSTAVAMPAPMLLPEDFGKIAERKF